MYVPLFVECESRGAIMSVSLSGSTNLGGGYEGTCTHNQMFVFRVLFFF